MAKKRVMITMEESLLERLDAACSSQGISKSAYLSTLVAKDLEDSQKVLEQFKELIEQAVSDIKSAG